MDHWSSPNGCHPDCPACIEDDRNAVSVTHSVTHDFTVILPSCNDELNASFSGNRLHLTVRKVGAVLPLEEHKCTVEDLCTLRELLSAVISHASKP